MTKGSRGEKAGRKCLEKRKKFKAGKTKRFTIRAEGAPILSGVVTAKAPKTAQQPNSAVRFCVRVQLTKSLKKVTAFVPYDGAMKYVSEHSEVTLKGCKGILGRSFGDLSNLCFKVVTVDGLCLRSLTNGRIIK